MHQIPAQFTLAAGCLLLAAVAALPELVQLLPLVVVCCSTHAQETALALAALRASLQL
jgi:hypothetical protein